MRLSFIEFLLQGPLHNPAFVARYAPELIDSINKALRRNGIPLVFGEKEFAKREDDLTKSEVDETFWKAVREPGLESVDGYMRQAIEERNLGAADPAVSAAKSLEATMRWIVEKNSIPVNKGGAGAHLAEKICHAGLIDRWERDMIVEFFRSVRNPLSHGSAGPRPSLSPPQTTWAIHYCMITIRRLLP